jgi:hypothetical protein
MVFTNFEATVFDQEKAKGQQRRSRFLRLDP